MIKNRILFVFTILMFSNVSFALDPQGWAKKLGPNKSRKISQQHTTVAAIRGVEAPGDVDPKARNFKGVELMEARIFPQDNIFQFIKEGSLKEFEPKKSAPGSSGADLFSGGLMQAPVSQEMKSAVRPITVEEEIVFGRDVAANVIAQFGLVDNEALNLYVNRVGLTVARACPYQEVTYRFAVLDSPIINAFAAPGGYIFISKGLLSLLKDEAQLACILGHEIAHVAQRHVVKEIQKSNLIQAAIPSYVKESAKQAVWMKQVTGLAIQMMWKGLSREDELESDKLGLEWASACGYRAQSFREVLELLKSKSQGSSAGKEMKFLLSTHPKPEDRIRACEEKLNLLPQDGELLSERYKSQAKM